MRENGAGILDFALVALQFCSHRIEIQRQIREFLRGVRDDGRARGEIAACDFLRGLGDM